MATAVLALSAIAVVVSHCCEGAGVGNEVVTGTVVTSRVHQMEDAAGTVANIAPSVAVVVLRTGATEADEIPVAGELPAQALVGVCLGLMLGIVLTLGLYPPLTGAVRWSPSASVWPRGRLVVRQLTPALLGISRI